MRNPFYVLAAKVYKKRKPIFNRRRNDKVYQALKQLHPLENTEKMLEQFQVKKTAAMAVMLLAGGVSAVGTSLYCQAESRLTEDAQLVRNEWGEGNYQVTLHVESEDWDKEIPFQVKERILTDAEQEALAKALYGELPEIIQMENRDLLHIVSELNLISSVSGYPFKLIWNSSNNDRISRTGKINRIGLAQPEKIDLTVAMCYEEQKFSHCYQVILLPEVLNEEEQFFRSLEDQLQKRDEEGKNRKEIYLPEHLLDREIQWQETKKGNIAIPFFLSLLGCIWIGKGMENDLEKSCKKRSRQLMADYSGFVSKLRLYLSAGLTIKNAFFRIAADYKNKQKQKQRNYLYEEIKIACFQLENGVMEEQAYREFGKRCGETRYRKLSFLLGVHLKKGNDSLLLFLSEEADGAWEDRRNMARKAGEEAATKLLLPMMLMLVVVMFLILLPAYLDFGTI